MKIVCHKGTDAAKMLGLIQRMLETDSMDYPLLKEDLVLELTLTDKEGHSCPKDEETICLEEKDLQSQESAESIMEYYYNKDALTKLYNRGKYERDIARLQADGAEGEFTCIYIDVVGLHEINNHLGHAAGDSMLCSVADGIRENFVQSTAYRIGGDEFVIFCFGLPTEQVKLAVFALREQLKQQDYEISVGIETGGEDEAFVKTINRAEHAMRYDKAKFYKENGEKRQMRSLNHKLEKILLEKQDASQFLNVIAAEYKGVYMVNLDKDACRYIYIPEYFRDILEENDGVFSKSIRMYCDRFVCDADRDSFYKVLDFDSVYEQIKQGNQIEYFYRKKDGSGVRLQITIYDPNSADSREMLWIFMDGDF